MTVLHGILLLLMQHGKAEDPFPSSLHVELRPNVRRGQFRTWPVPPPVCPVCSPEHQISSRWWQRRYKLEAFVFNLPLQLLVLAQLSDSLVEVVLADCIAVVLDGKKTPES